MRPLTSYYDHATDYLDFYLSKFDSDGNVHPYWSNAKYLEDRWQGVKFTSTGRRTA